jgi:formate dehydrogenase accessory protein FdhD
MATKVDLSTNSKKNVEDYVAVEESLDLYINNEYSFTFFASPSQKKEMIIGSLLSEGMIIDLNNVRKIELEDNVAKVEIESNSAQDYPRHRSKKKTSKHFDQSNGPLIESDFSIEAELLLKLIEKTNKKSKTFNLTGGTHYAALIYEDKIALFSEDVGRHNAIDKVIGNSALKGLDFKKSVLISSGRQPADMVMKAARVGIPIIASISGPLNSGILAAKKAGLTLVCFARGQKLNIYTSAQRIIV